MDMFLGIDAGSTVCKAAVFDKSGRILSAAAERTPLSRPGAGRVEADPSQAWSAVCNVIREACTGAPDHGHLVGLGIAGAMVGAWVVDETGKTLRPGINWEDSRAQPMIDELTRSRPTMMSEIFATSGSVMQQGCTLPVVAALLREEPEIMRAAHAVLGYKDWLRFRLTGAIMTDPSEAAVAPGDARGQGRSDALFDMFGLREHRALFPAPIASETIAGHVTHAAAAETGLPVGLPVVTGAGDVIANVIGAGGLAPGTITGLLGTTCMIGVCHDEPVFAPPDLGLLFSLPEAHWFRAMVNVAGTLNLDWAVSLLCPDLAERDDGLEQVTAMAAAEPVGARGLTYLPYLSESGIIAPVADPTARAQFIGLAPPHDRATLLRAVYEGVAFSIADLCDLLSPTKGAPILLTGGGGRSAFWCQMIADVTNRTVIVPEGDEFGARGAALLLATALGHFPSVVAASASVPEGGRRHEPLGHHSAGWFSARSRYTAARDRALGT